MLPKSSNTPGAFTPCSDLSNRIYASESAPSCQINPPAQSKQNFTSFYTWSVLKGWKWLSCVVVRFLTWCYPPQQRTPVPPRTSPVRTASAFQPAGAVMASQSVLTVLTRLMQPAVSVPLPANVCWDECLTVSSQQCSLSCSSACLKLPERCSSDAVSCGSNMFNDICTSTFHGHRGQRKQDDCLLLTEITLIRGELEMTAECPSLHRSVYLHALFCADKLMKWLRVKTLTKHKSSYMLTKLAMAGIENCVHRNAFITCVFSHEVTCFCTHKLENHYLLWF